MLEEATGRACRRKWRYIKYTPLPFFTTCCRAYGSVVVLETMVLVSSGLEAKSAGLGLELSGLGLGL